MGYWDNQDEYSARGIDYDLAGCLEYNPQEGFALEDIKQVLAVWLGENDGDDWRWILLLRDGQFVYLSGGCDYTGWDCVSNATSSLHPDIKSAFTAVREDEDNGPGLIAELAKQLTSGKPPTWSETFSID